MTMDSVSERHAQTRFNVHSSAPGGSRQNDLGDNRIGHDNAAVIQVTVINGSSARRFIFGHLLLTSPCGVKLPVMRALLQVKLPGAPFRHNGGERYLTRRTQVCARWILNNMNGAGPRSFPPGQRRWAAYSGVLDRIIGRRDVDLA